MECVPCGEFAPHPVNPKPGRVEVDEVWGRLACDVTHVGRRAFLSVIDCGPSRYAVWQPLAREGEDDVIATLERVFRWLGPPPELLSDNALAFRSKKFRLFCKEWGVTQKFRGVNRAEGNAIVERNHGTVKTMFIRTGGKVEDLVHVYNLSPQGKNRTIPAEVLFGRRVQNPYVTRLAEALDNGAAGPVDNDDFEEKKVFDVGDRVVVRPKNPRCMERWKPGTVTAINSERNVDVDGLSRHVKDVRHSRRPRKGGAVRQE